MNSAANAVMTNSKRWSEIRGPTSGSNAPNVRARNSNASSPFVPGAPLKTRTAVRAAVHSRRGSAEPDRFVTGGHGVCTLRTRLESSPSYHSKRFPKEVKDELGIVPHRRCNSGLGDPEPLGLAQIRDPNLNVRFVWNWRFHQERPAASLRSVRRQQLAVIAEPLGLMPTWSAFSIGLSSEKMIGSVFGLS
jgi:hypothetical protein